VYNIFVAYLLLLLKYLSNMKLMAKNSEQTIIAYGVRVEGQFTCSGDIQVEGEVHGTIHSDGDLRVGDRSKIMANVSVQNAHISGHLEGNLKVAGKLELTESANITGDVSVDILVMAAGAKINGTIQMGELRTKASKDSE
jgi:cytoskeletal protein CcmA (bactofilin family)